jgi:homoserine kinase type II
MKPDCHEIYKAAETFGISIKKIIHDADIQGSPERTDFRCVAEDVSGRRYLVEQFSMSKADSKKRISDTVNLLHKSGLIKTIPYICTASGETIHIQEKGNRKTAWQASEFIESDILPRPDYVMIPETGHEFAGFLADLSETALSLFKPENSLNLFSIKDYIISTFRQIEVHNPEIVQKIKPVMNFLHNVFFKVHDSLKKGFCHGDIHPMNAIWEGFRIKAVIDWEFMGFKPEIYDLANLAGCIGIESPDALGGDLVRNLIKDLKNRGIYENRSWDILPEFVIAVRFGWLSEWLRKNDTEMIELETDYMNLLVDYCNDIKSHWNSIKGGN